MKAISLIGARPQFIKEAIIHEEFKNAGIEEVLANSGQHYDFNMADIFFQVLNIRKPDYNLEIGSGKHGEMTGKIIIEFEKIVEKVKPDLVLVYGDTNTTLAGAIVTSKTKIPLAHVEAGIRQEPKDMPEETNRILTDRVSNYLFCASESAVQNLKLENITKNVFFTGDVMFDLFLKMEKLFKYGVFNNLKLEKNKYILLTLHRDFNVDDRNVFEKILVNIEKISKEVKIVFPIHPRTRKRVSENNFDHFLKNVTVIEPVDYPNLMGLTKNCLKVVTDSGGFQKEAYFAEKEAIVVMPDTGWRELTDCGWNKLADGNNLYNKVFENQKVDFQKNIYGDGKSGRKIVEILKKYL